MANRPEKQLKGVGLFLLAIVFVAAIGIPWKFSGFWTGLGSFFSPVPMYNTQDASEGMRFLYFLFYLTGTTIVSGVLISIFTNIIRTAGERYTNGTARYKFNDHILFLGYDDMEIGTLRKELQDNPDAIVVVAVPDNVPAVRNTIYQYLMNGQSERVIVIQASRINLDDLRTAAHIQNARRIYIIGQSDEETHDANNLKCLGMVAGMCYDLQHKPMCMYYMRNHATFSLMQRQNLTVEYLHDDICSACTHYDKTKVEKYLGNHCDPFNFYESVARKLLFNLNDYENSLKVDWHNSQDNLTGQPHLQPHLVIIGMTEMGTALAKVMLMATHFPNKKLKISFVDNNAYEEMHYFTGRYESFFNNCHYVFRNYDNPAKDETHKPQGEDFLDVEFEFIQCDVAHPKLREMLMQSVANKDKELLTIAVCSNDAPKNMAFVLYLARPILENVPIWVYQKNNTGMDSFLDHNIYKQVRIFSLMNMEIPIPEKAIEYELAKQVAHTYDVLYGCESDWSQKDATEKWSSLYNALSIVVKLRMAGYGLRLSISEKNIEPFDLVSGSAVGSIHLTEKQEGEFAIAEHSRWNAEKLMAGFSPTTEQQHQDIMTGNLSSKELKKNFIHDDIRPFNELSKGEQEKDFTLTRSLINMINNYSK